MARHGARYLRVDICRAQGNSGVAAAESSGDGGVRFSDGTGKKTAARWANAVSAREGRRDTWRGC